MAANNPASPTVPLWGAPMHTLQTFWVWLTRSSDKAEKLAFKNQREAAEFVRRLYNENGAPNAKLRELYRRGRELREAEEGPPAAPPRAA
jgi:hypothetical protein